MYDEDGEGITDICPKKYIQLMAADPIQRAVRVCIRQDMNSYIAKKGLFKLKKQGFKHKAAYTMYQNPKLNKAVNNIFKSIKDVGNMLGKK